MLYILKSSLANKVDDLTLFKLTVKFIDGLVNFLDICNFR